MNEVTFNVDELTVGQAEFICDYTQRSLTEFAEVLGTTELSARDIVAILAVIENPENPNEALEAVRAQPIAHVDLSGLNPTALASE